MSNPQLQRRDALTDRIRRDYVDGRPPGHRLPPTGVLAQRYGVVKHTITRHLQRIADATGRVELVSRHGWYIVGSDGDRGRRSISRVQDMVRDVRAEIDALGVPGITVAGPTALAEAHGESYGVAALALRVLMDDGVIVKVSERKWVTT